MTGSTSGVANGMVNGAARLAMKDGTLAEPNIMPSPPALINRRMHARNPAAITRLAR